MKILIIGDTHNDLHLHKVPQFLELAKLSKRDALIHCGDWGAAWGGEEDEALLFWRSLPFAVLVCLGNHENYSWVKEQPLIRRHNCLGYDLGGRVFAPLPGQIATLGGRRLWFYPGGLSIDFYFRTPGFNLYEEELLSLKEADNAIHRLEKSGYADFVISHDGPRDWVSARFGFPLKPPPESYYQHLGIENASRVHPGFALNRVYSKPALFGKWYFGHHHKDVSDGRLRCLWERAALIDLKTGEETLI